MMQRVRSLLMLFLVLSCQWAIGQDSTEVCIPLDSGQLCGTLLLPPETQSNVPLAILVAGSGPTDRDGNSPMTQNNALKMLAEQLEQAGIASFRYDKRAIGKSAVPNFKEEDLVFEDFIGDLERWIQHFRKQNRFSSIAILGHSEGSLIGMIAAHRQQTDAFVSIAGAGIPADDVIAEQIRDQYPKIADTTRVLLDRLREGKQIDSVAPYLYSLFRPSVRPYMVSWMHYDPAIEIQKLSQPVLLIQGNHDLQVGEQHIDSLSKALPQAERVVIDSMNHVLKPSPKQWAKNINTYNDPELPLSKEFVKEIKAFLRRVLD